MAVRHVRHDIESQDTKAMSHRTQGDESQDTGQQVAGYRAMSHSIQGKESQNAGK